jgi:tetratricopeptide (TPR) repeat protein
MLILSVATIVYHAKYSVRISGKVLFTAKLLTIPAIMFLVRAAGLRMSDEMHWRRIAHQSLAGKTEQMLPAYERLRPALSGNELFLYNYTAELNVAKRYDKSLEIGRECERLWADYDLQMLMADNNVQLQQYEEAERRYRKAAAMCPVKFMPLYRLAKQYDAVGDKSRAQELAKIILDKRIKIPSPVIQSIRNEMLRMIDEETNEFSGQNLVSERPVLEMLLPP